MSHFKESDALNEKFSGLVPEEINLETMVFIRDQHDILQGMKVR
jgi:hypothetical protein